jgi:hypothetical protein
VHYWGCGGLVSCSIPMCCCLFGLCHGMYSFRFNVCSGGSPSSFLRFGTNTLVINQTKFSIYTRNKDFGLLYSSHAITKITLVEFCDIDWHEEVDSCKNTTSYTFVLRAGAINWSNKCQPTITLSSRGIIQSYYQNYKKYKYNQTTSTIYSMSPMNYNNNPLW